MGFLPGSFGCVALWLAESGLIRQSDNANQAFWCTFRPTLDPGTFSRRRLGRQQGQEVLARVGRRRVNTAGPRRSHRSLVRRKSRFCLCLPGDSGNCLAGPSPPGIGIPEWKRWDPVDLDRGLEPWTDPFEMQRAGFASFLLSANQSMQVRSS